MARAAWILMGLMMMGCTERHQPQEFGVEPGSAPAVEHTAKPVADTTPAHRSPGKPSAGFALADNTPHRIEPGIPSDLNLAVIAPNTTGTMHIELEATEGLEILAAPSVMEFALGQREYSLPLQVFASEAGRYYLRLRITLEGEGRQMHSVISAIVQAGPDAPKAKNHREKAKENTEEPEFISLPAEETVYPSPH